MPWLSKKTINMALNFERLMRAFFGLGGGWRRMEKISWTDHMRNEEVLLRVKEQRNILHEIRKWKANWIGHILRRNCLLQHVTEGKIKGG